MLAVVLIVIVVLLVLAALLTPWRGGGETDAEVAEEQRLRAATTAVLDLEAARDAKYREIRDAELDRETGHLTGEDFSGVDANLRAEAVEILKQLDRAQARLTKLQVEAQAAGLPPDPDLERSLGPVSEDPTAESDSEGPEHPRASADTPSPRRSA